MKIKLDENLPLRLVHVLAEFGHETDTVPQENLAEQNDSSVLDAAKRAGRFFITQDLDFSDVRRFTPGTHQGILLVRLRESGRTALRNRIHTVFQAEQVEDWTAALSSSPSIRFESVGPNAPDVANLRSAREHFDQLSGGW